MMYSIEEVAVDGTDGNSDTGMGTTLVRNGDDDDRNPEQRGDANTEIEGSTFNIDSGKSDLLDGRIPPPPRPHAQGRIINPERAKMRIIPGPVMPSKREVEEHMLCHIPCAPWCSCCVAARALDDKHALWDRQRMMR